jgi:hypothetical protein
MTIFELLQQADKTNEELVGKIETAFGFKIPSVLEIILSSSPDFYDTENCIYRLLDADEILDAQKHLGIDLIDKHILPVFDISDNDFICFNFDTGKYIVFNIIDQIDFFISDSLEELLQKLEN